jgi:hypothetical protein
MVAKAEIALFDRHHAGHAQDILVKMFPCTQTMIGEKLRAAGMSIKESADIRAAMWMKLLSNAALIDAPCELGALAGVPTPVLQTIGRVVRHKVTVRDRQIQAPPPIRP